MNFTRPLQKTWTQAILLSSSTVSFFVLTLGIGIVPYKADDIWQSKTLSIIDCTLHNDGRFAVASVWTHNLFGRKDYLVAFSLDRAKPAMQIPWKGLSPRTLTSDPQRGLVYVGDASGSIYLIDVTRLDAPPKPIVHHPGACLSRLACSPDGKRLAVICEEALYIWDLNTKKLQHVWSERAVQDVAIMPDSQRAICGLVDGSVVELDLVRGGFVRELARLNDPVVRVAVCPRGERIAALGFNGGLYLMNAVTNRILWTRAQGWTPPVLTFAPGGDSVISSGFVGGRSCFIVYASQTGQRLATLQAQWHEMRGVVFNRSGQIVSWGSDSALRVWNQPCMAESGTKDSQHDRGAFRPCDRMFVPQWENLEPSHFRSLASTKKGQRIY